MHFFFCSWNSVLQLFQYHFFFQTIPFSTELLLYFCQKAIGYIHVSLFLDSTVPLICISVHSPIPHCLDNCNFIKSENQTMWSCQHSSFSELF